MTTENKSMKIFFSGIAGSGVSAIARFMADKGHEISGSDRAFDDSPAHPLKEAFELSGVSLFRQDGSGIDETLDLAVFSTAVEDGHPELEKAEKLGVRILKRPDFLSGIASSYETIAVSGTSGKSTTSGMLAFVMERLGLSPNFIGGGRVRQFRSSTNPGNSMAGNSNTLVIEACESDGTIVNYKPKHSIILNLALDHHSIDETASMFSKLVMNTSGKVVINADDSNLARISSAGLIYCSVDKPSDYRAEDVEYKSLSTEFSLRGVRFRLSIPGKYNLYNAVACIALLSEMGVAPDSIASVLPEFRGIERRFDIHLDDGKKIVIDDYAHNPHKIASMMDALSRVSDNVCYIFQPHGFGPTRLMKDEYIKTFQENLRETDRLILLPIYYTGGAAVQDISSNDLAEGIIGLGGKAEAVRGREDLIAGLGNFSVYVLFGARDETLSGLAGQIAEAVKDISP